MSSQLTTLVPVMDGTNYQLWAASMQSFLMSQGQWKCVKEGAAPPKVTETKEGIFGQTEHENWLEDAEKALGNIRLRLAPTVGYQFNGEESPSTLWEVLKTKYGKPGVNSAFLEFKGIMDTVIPNGADPSPALDKITAHHMRLKEMKWEIPDNVIALIMMAKAPSNMESVIKMTSMVLAEDEANIKRVEPERIANSMRTSWEAWKRNKGKGKEPQQASKVSVVKPFGTNPQFQQQQQKQPQQAQQQQRGDGDVRGRGRGRRGKRGGKRVQQQQLAQVDAQMSAQYPLPGQVGPSAFQQSPPPQSLPQPPFQWVQAPIPPPPFNPYTSPLPGQPTPQDSGYFASAILAGRPLPPTPPMDPSKGKWKTFGSALSLAHRIGVKPTTETLKTLEMAEMAKEEREPRGPRDPRPPKRAKKELPRGVAQGLSEKLTEDDEVSLGYSTDGMEGIEEDGDNHLATFEYDVDGEASGMASLDMMRQVQSPMSYNVTDRNLQLDKYIALCLHNNSNNFSCSHSKCDCDDKLEEWIIDSGASMHFTNSIDDFIQYEEEVMGQILVKTANSSAVIKGKGTVILVLSTGETVRIRPVFYIQGLNCKLLSLGKFLRRGYKCDGNAESIRVMKGSKTFLTFYPRSGLDSIYVVKSHVAKEKDIFMALSTIYGIDYDVIHRRLAHPSKEVLLKARKHLKDFPEIEFPTEEHLCPGCALGKMTNRSYPPSTRRATAPFELIHSDLKSFPIDSYRKFRYVIVFFDDYTSAAWTVNLRTKDAALTATSHFIKLIENRFKSTIIQWMSDAGGEYKSRAFDKMLKDRGIEILQSIPYAHQQNGRAERIIRTIMEKAESMRLQACIPQSWWEFAVEHATHVYNRTPLRRHNWQTPYQLLHGEKPSIDHLKIFGCGAYVFIPAEIRANKLAPKSEIMTYLGNAPGAGGFTFMRSPNNVLFYSTHCIFDESLFPKCHKPVNRNLTRLLDAPPPHQYHENNQDPVDEDVTPLRRRTHRGPESQQDAIPPPRQEGEPALEPPNDPLPPVQSAPPPQGRAAPPPPPQALRRSTRQRNIPKRPENVYGDRHPVEILRDPTGRKGRKTTQGPVQKTGENVPGPSNLIPETPEAEDRGVPLPPISPTESEREIERGLSHPDPVADRLCQEGGIKLLLFLIAKAVSPTDTATTSPKEWSYKDIARLPELEQKDWRDACLKELEALRRRETFQLVPRPQGRKVIKNRWVFDVKTDGRKKARLVAKGFSQVEGLDYDAVFSPVVRFETVRLILSMAALNDWYMTGLDVRNAYLYGKLDEEIYMEQPEGFVVPGREHEVLRLKRALYGLKQAGLAWWRALRDSMKDLGFESLESDAGLFIYKSSYGFVIAVVYVDDALFCGSNRALIHDLKRRFMQKWECRDLGEVTEFLRMKIHKESSKISIDPCASLQTVLERCGMQNCKSAASPLPAGYMPEPVSLDTVIDPELRSRYQMVIGSLLYLMLGTRPDIAFAVTKLAQHAARPSEEHFSKALYICRYLRGTSNHRLTYDGKSGQELIACTDSDWASDKDDRCSQTGYFLKLAGGAISWTSRAQKTIALSSTEAEYMALSDCSRRVVWMHSLMGELGYYLKPVPICGDNQGSIFIASNPVTEKRSKHIDIRYHYIREVVEHKLVEVYFIDGDKNPADLLTKNLGSVKFLLFGPDYGLSFLKEKAHAHQGAA